MQNQTKHNPDSHSVGHANFQEVYPNTFLSRCLNQERIEIQMSQERMQE